MTDATLSAIDHDEATAPGSPRPLAAKATGLTRRFGAAWVLDGIDLELRQGEFVALVGKTGSGKTTLLRILAGLDRPDDGVVLVPEERTVVFQEPRLIPSKRVWRNVTLGLRGPQGTRRAALDALRLVGLEDHALAWPATLSGGEAQRVALARALIRHPRLLLLDEPFASLDALTRRQMQQLVGALVERLAPGTLIVTHDVDEALLLADRVLLLRDGRLELELPVTLPRPRHDFGPEFDALRRILLRELGVLDGDPTNP